MTPKETTMKPIPKALVLKQGSHASMEAGACVMEVVSYVAGEAWSDMPACACPIISKAAQALNDCAPDDETRTRVLKPYISRLVGTRSTPEIEQKRMFVAVDIAVRVFAAEAMDLAGLKAEADKLKALKPVVVIRLANAYLGAAGLLEKAADQLDMALLGGPRPKPQNEGGAE